MSLLVIAVLVMALLVVVGAIFCIAALAERLETPKKPEEPVLARKRAA